MNDQIFMATTGSDLARASRQADGRWEVERLLPGSDVRCTGIVSPSLAGGAQPMIQATPRRWAGWISTSTALAWLGLYLYNVADLPNQPLFSVVYGAAQIPLIALMAALFSA